MKKLIIILLIIVILFNLFKNNFKEGFGKETWYTGLTITPYYDCAGKSCDAHNLKPWNNAAFVAPQEYTILDPNDFGGPIYGEKLWIYGSASDKLVRLLNMSIPELGNIPEQENQGSCGRSILIKNRNATRRDWTALIMQKGRCAPWNPKCRDAIHMDILVPGFNYNNQYSANRCGGENTALLPEEAGICGALIAPVNCIKCHKIRNKLLSKGCQLFVDWGWKTREAVCEWKIVKTPPEFIKYTKAIQLSNQPTRNKLTIDKPNKSIEKNKVEYNISDISPSNCNCSENFICNKNNKNECWKICCGVSPAPINYIKEFNELPYSITGDSTHLCANLNEQCGGINWAGAACCEIGTTCTKINDNYSKCEPKFK